MLPSSFLWQQTSKWVRGITAAAAAAADGLNCPEEKELGQFFLLISSVSSAHQILHIFCEMHVQFKKSFGHLLLLLLKKQRSSVLLCSIVLSLSLAETLALKKIEKS